MSLFLCLLAIAFLAGGLVTASDVSLWFCWAGAGLGYLHQLLCCEG